MAYLKSYTSATTKSELDLFTTPPIQNSVESGSLQCFRPVSALQDDSPIEFVVPGTLDEYIDLARTTIHIVAKPIIDENNEIQDNTQFSTVNNLLHSLFSQVDIYLNQRCISSSSQHYNYRSYIENLLNFGADAKESHLQCSFWHADDDVRRGKIRADRLIDMYGHLHCCLFNQNKFLVNGVELRVKLNKSTPEFYLFGNRTGRIRIVDANLHIRKVKINPSILVAHARALAISNAKYPITRVEIKTFTITAGVSGKSVDNLYLSQLPKRVIVGMVTNAAFNGSIETNPYKFQHFNHNFISLYVDSVQVPTVPLNPDFTQGSYTRSYDTLFSQSGVSFTDTGNKISLADYADGNCLVVFDLTSDLSSHEPHWNIIKSGCLRLEVRFAAATTQPITIVVYSEFDNLIEIDQHRNILIDYNS